MTELENAIDEAVRIYVKAVHAEDPNFSFDDLPEVHKFQLRSLVMSMVWPVMKAAKAQAWDEGHYVGQLITEVQENPYRD